TGLGVLHAHLVRPRRLLLWRVGLVAVLVRASVEALDVRDQVDELGEREAIAIIRHDRPALRSDVSRPRENHRTWIPDRLREVLGGRARALAGEPGPDVAGAAAPRKVRLHLVALVALELGEDLAPRLRIPRRERELPTARHTAAAMQFLHRDRRGRRARWVRLRRLSDGETTECEDDGERGNETAHGHDDKP